MGGVKLSEAQIVNAVRGELSRCESFADTKISFERALAYDYYFGRPFGNEKDGRSQVISADVSQAVDSAVPAIVKIFVSGDKAVEFTPRGPEDVESAEQATLSANYVFFTQNNGYALAHDFIKDGLLQKTGVFKWRWDTSVTMHEKTYRGLDDATLAMLSEAPDTEIIEHTEYPDPNPPPMMGPPDAQMTPLSSGVSASMPQQPPMLHDVTVRVKKEAGKVRIIVPAPEEVKISPDAMTLDVMDMPFIAHTPLLTASDLLEMGIEQSVIDTLPSGDEGELDDEKVARRERNNQISSLDDSDQGDSSRKVYRYNECYIKLDVDGDGIAELRNICTVGTKILHDEPVDHIPMAIWTPKVMPHEVIGMSLADEVMDIQLLKSTIWRCAMDNFYLAIAPRMFLKGNVDLEGVLTVKPGGYITGDANSEASPIVVPDMTGSAFSMLEYADQEEEVRTGVSRLFQGIDPQAINKTATGVNALINQANARVELIARNAAEFGFKPLFKGILYLLAKHQQQSLMVRLSNKFVPVDPETWSKEYDMSCNVGLGMGTKDQQLMHLQALTQDMAMVAQSPFAPLLLDAEKIFNLEQKKAELAGFKDVTVFFNDPKGKEPPPQPPPPEIQKAQMQIQADQQKQQAQMQMDAQKQQAEMGFEQQKLQMQMQLEQYKAEKDAELAVFKAQLEAQTKKEIALIEAQLNHEREQHRIAVEGEVGMKQAESAAKPAVAVQLDKTVGDSLQGIAKGQAEGLAQAMQTLTAALHHLSQPKAPGRRIVKSSRGVTYDIQDVQ